MGTKIAHSFEIPLNEGTQILGSFTVNFYLVDGVSETHSVTYSGDVRDVMSRYTEGALNDMVVDAIDNQIANIIESPKEVEANA